MKLLATDRDHLHIRGEYFELKNYTQFELGSSPHTWRIPLKIDKEYKSDRIISTYVENTDVDEDILRIDKDHLHIRGEYSTLRTLELLI